MSEKITVTWTKDNSTFASGTDAYADKNSLFSAELAASMNDCYSSMLTNGILLEPLSYAWDQVSYTLTIDKIVSSIDAYEAAVTFNVVDTNSAARAAGWIGPIKI